MAKYTRHGGSTPVEISFSKKTPYTHAVSLRKQRRGSIHRLLYYFPLFEQYTAVTFFS